MDRTPPRCRNRISKCEPGRRYVTGGICHILLLGSLGRLISSAVCTHLALSVLELISLVLLFNTPWNH